MSTQQQKATAIAHPNIALVKYWGKRDEALILPHQSSFSMTLAPLEVKATVGFGGSADDVQINGRAAEGKERERVVALVDRVRAEHRTLGPVRVVTQGNFPMAAGLASSAAAFAAIAVALRAAAGLPKDPRAASILARLGSGSAARSVEGGFCAWRRGQAADGSDSYAEQLFDARHWPELRMMAVVVSGEEKEVKSRDGMRHTVETSPYYPAWIADAEAELPRAVDLVRARDLEGLGALCERNAWRMHATAMAANPPLCYLKPKTLQLIQAVASERRWGLPVWFTLDAGPNPVLLTTEQHLDACERFARQCGAEAITRCEPGGDARLVDQHLF